MEMGMGMGEILTFGLLNVGRVESRNWGHIRNGSTVARRTGQPSHSQSRATLRVTVECRSVRYKPLNCLSLSA